MRKEDVFRVVKSLNKEFFEFNFLVLFFCYRLFLGALEGMDNRWYSGKQEMHIRRQQKSDEVRLLIWSDLCLFLCYMWSFWM